MKRNTWYQIHTNGGTTTFARYTRQEAAQEKGDVEILVEVGVFEKLSVDTTTPQGGAEIFGREEFEDEGAAMARLAEAVELAR